jgi:hypothetical protein
MEKDERLESALQEEIAMVEMIHYLWGVYLLD